jgi:predicted 2-oxoglutarate/Fe(II)-dependent dioxygenase YbiX
MDDRIIISDFLCPTICEVIIASHEPATKTPIGVVSQDGVPSTDESRRIAFRYRSTERALILDLVRRIIVELVQPHYATSIEFFAAPRLISYPVGGFGCVHVDGETLVNGEWVRQLDRDYLMSIYLNAGYDGGQLYFPDQDVTVEPVPGRIVVAPATREFPHGVHPVTRGERFQMTTWLTAHGTERTHEEHKKIVYL